MCSQSTRRLGIYGEDLACKYLQAKGYTILERNFRCRRFGEVDIVASKAGVLSFIEVLWYKSIGNSDNSTGNKMQLSKKIQFDW